MGVVDDLEVLPREAGRRTHRLGERLLGGEPAGQGLHRKISLGLGEQPAAHRRRTFERLGEPREVDHVDPDAQNAHSTVTDLARLRGWSTSWPSWLANSHAKICSGTVATSGCSSVGTLGSRIT